MTPARISDEDEQCNDLYAYVSCDVMQSVGLGLSVRIKASVVFLLWAPWHARSVGPALSRPNFLDVDVDVSWKTRHDHIVVTDDGIQPLCPLPEDSLADMYFAIHTW